MKSEVEIFFRSSFFCELEKKNKRKNATFSS